MPPKKAALVCFAELVFLISLFALLVSDTTAGFASRLTRSLAFATTAVFSAFAKVTGFNGFNMFHNEPPYFYNLLFYYIT